MAALTKAERVLRKLHKHFEVCHQCNYGPVLCEVGKGIYNTYKDSKNV